MKLGFPFWAVRTVAILMFGALIFLGGRVLKKAFDAKRSDLCFEVEHDRIVFTKKGKKFGETFLNDQFEFLIGPAGEMGLGFPSGEGQLSVGCIHQTMSWKEGRQASFHFELEPSDFIRLVGELGLENQVEINR